MPDRNSVTGEPEGSAPGVAARAAPPIEHILVCVNEHATSAGLLHYGQRLAGQHDARWTAIYVETARHRRLNEGERDRIADCLRLAEKLGSDAMTLPGDRVADEILAFARENGVTQIVIGKSRPRHWFDLWRPLLARTLARRAKDIGLHVVSREEAGLPPVPASMVATASPSRSFDPFPYVVSIGLLALLTALGCVFRDYLKLTEVALIYLTLVLITAARFGLLPSLVLSALSMLAFDFFWVPPVYTWDIDDPRDWFVLLVLVAVAMCTSYLTARTGAQMLVARRHAKTTAELYAFSRRLSAISRLDLLLNTSAYQVSMMLRARVVILLSEEGRLVPRAAYRGPGQLGEAELAAASWVWHNDRPAGHGADTLGGGSWLFLPLRTPRGMVAVLGIGRDPPNSLLTPEERRLLDALADQAAVAVERVSLAAEIDETRVLRETERLRSALLTSISHDLRTPLASVLGALADLRRDETFGDPEARTELLDTAQEEAERLNRFVGNLLDITRLEAGALEIKHELIDLTDVVGSAVRRARKLLGERRIKIDIPDELPMVRLDFVLFENVLFNLLDNAAKYSPPASMVCMRASRSYQRIALEIADEGSGIPPDDLERIFDKFYRLKAADRQRAGTGLGLAICRGFVEAQGGAIRAGNRSDRSGAVFTITLPVESDAVAAPPEPASTP